VLNEKRHIIRESGALELYPYTGSMNNVGGLGALKGWLDQRQEAFSQDAREYGLSMPKGVALIGIPGTGKSLCAKVTAGHWGMTLLRMDVGAIFSGLLGSSEQNIREAIRIAEVIAPCVLWVDEIEKAFAGSMGDSGTASRVFATFLTWMQEKTAPVFVFATANNVRRLPPELLRKGRFDEVFFLDLPTHGERIKILEVHLRERGYTMLSQRFNLAAVASATEGFVGAELQALVNDAMFPAFRDNRRELETEDLLNAAAEMVPLSASHQEHIEQLRMMVGNGQARNASDDRNALTASWKTGDNSAL
jgi:SpoVK/Ycf46/Vps4 family AAA+-type ATPase